MDTRTQDPALEVDSLLIDLIDAHTLSRLNFSWLGTLFDSILLAQSAGKSHLVSSLADLGVYLAQDHSNHSETQANHFEARHSLREHK